jgi:hypothetical protein
MLVPTQRRSNAAFAPYSDAPRVPNFLCLGFRLDGFSRLVSRLRERYDLKE